ncbi:hypothetical protein [Sandarakinorhabdus sp.]|uniref:hypothetical protein n=1 Tax=Sandarakinorhabdus sp. TaxID=1916663 RepID=UPI00356595C7
MPKRSFCRLGRRTRHVDTGSGPQLPDLFLISNGANHRLIRPPLRKLRHQAVRRLLIACHRKQRWRSSRDTNRNPQLTRLY